MLPRRPRRLRGKESSGERVRGECQQRSKKSGNGIFVAVAR